MISIISRRVATLVTCLALGWWLPSCAKAQPAVPSTCLVLDNTLIRAPGTAPVYLLRNGRKYHIQTPNWIKKNGYDWSAVHDLPPSEIAAIPTGYILTDDAAIPGTPSALDEKLVVGADGKVYVVTKGERHWILDWHWITESRYRNQGPLPVSDADLQALPLGINFTYTPPEARVRIVWLTPTLFAFLFTFLFLSAHDRSRHFFSGRINDFAKTWLLQKWKPWHTRAALFVAFAAAIALREPFLLAHPRFWAEEGTTWFQFATTHSVIRSILFVFPATGYIQLTANIGAVLASMTAARLGLEYAPVATTVLAFLIQLLPICLILFGISRLFDSLWKAVAGCLIVIFAPTTPDEIWLNTINAMSFLGLISLVLLFEETWNWPGWLRWGSRAILILCGLSSPYTAALIPLFVIYAVRDQKREQKVQCLILILCTLVQAGSVVRVGMEAAKTAAGVESFHRGTDVHLDTSLVNVFFGHIAAAALGHSADDLLIYKMGMMSAWTSASSLSPRPPSASLQAGGWLCFILIAIILWHLRGPTIYSSSNMLIAAFLTFAAFTCATSLYSVPLGRYAFLPGVTFLLILLVNLESAKSPVIRYASMVVLSYGLASGIMDYKSPRWQIGPSWSTEVQIWQTNHSHPLRVWPGFWTGGITYNPSVSR